MHSPSSRDLALLLDAAYDLARVDSAAELVEAANQWQLRLVPGERAGWVRIDLRTGRLTGRHTPQPVQHLLNLLPPKLSEIPLASGLISTPGLDVRKISDVWSVREWRAQPMYSLYRQASTVHQIITPLTCYEPGARAITSLTISRARTDFDERDRAVLSELSRHVRAARNRLRQDAELGLTTRQHEAIEAISDGASMAVAARRLGVTPKTLENHLQAAYRKLGVTNRVAALRRLGDSPHCRRDGDPLS